jgi:hypothetical protein
MIIKQLIPRSLKTSFPFIPNHEIINYFIHTFLNYNAKEAYTHISEKIERSFFS